MCAAAEKNSCEKNLDSTLQFSPPNPVTAIPHPTPHTMFALSTRSVVSGRRSVRANAVETGNWAPGTEKPAYLSGAPGCVFFSYLRQKGRPRPRGLSTASSCTRRHG
jgi:hypothetical protein